MSALLTKEKENPILNIPTLIKMVQNEAKIQSEGENTKKMKSGRPRIFFADKKGAYLI